MSGAVHDWQLYDRLFKFARKLGCDEDAARDLAGQAYVNSFEKGVAEWHYASVCLKNLFLINIRDRKRRNLDYKFHEFDNGEIVEMSRLSTLPTQEVHIEVKAVLAAFTILPETTSRALKLAGLEYTADEISDKLEIPKKEVYWRLRVGRKILRDRGYYDAPQKRGHREYIGIRKDHHRWSSAIRSGTEYSHLGYFGTAKEAAEAYDRAARRLHGKKTKTNFLTFCETE